MKAVTTLTFGPGSLESLTLVITSTDRITHPRHFRARLTGSYSIFCGMGNEHTIEIDADEEMYETDKGEMVDHIRRAREGDIAAKEAFAHIMIEWAVEDWFDPCDVGDEVE